MPEQKISDEERTAWLNDKGYKVVRFKNDDVVGNIDGVINIIKQNLNNYDYK